MIFFRKIIFLPVLFTISALVYTSTATAQMRKIYEETGYYNDIQKLSFYSPSEGYIASTGDTGAWIGYTSDSGHTFIKKFITRGNVSYGFNPVNLTFGFSIRGVKAFDKNHLLAYGDYGAEPAIIYSADGGNSYTMVYWSAYTLSVTNGIFDIIFPANNNVGYAIDETHVLKTTNGGTSWSVIASSPNNLFSNIEAPDNNNVFVLSTGSTNNGVIKTTNAGSSWQTVPLPQSSPASDMSYVHFLTASSGWLNKSDGTFYKTTDGGNSWILLNNAITPFSCTKLKFTDVNTGYAISEGKKIYKTVNGGVNWEPLPRDNNDFPYHSDLQLISANQLWAGGYHDFLEISTNGGGIPIPKAYCSADTTGFLSGGIVKLNNYSRTDYTYQWFINNSPVSTTYNATYNHNPDSELDTIKLVVSNGISTDTSIIYQSFYPRARITSFTPTTSGSGTEVTINGLNLTDVTAVSFGEVNAARFTIVSSTKITAIVGNGASGNVKITASTGKDSLAGFNFIPGPVINSVAPLASVSGTTITITGNNFSTVTAVYFDSIPAAAFTIVSPTVITAVTPSGSSGAVTVVSAGGTQIFPGYIALPTMSAFSPSSGTQGSILNIAGTSLTGITSVTVGGVNVLSFTINSSTRITASVGSGGPGDVIISKTGGSSSLPGYTWFTSPIITSFSPASGPAGTAVVITGANFNATPANNIVYFGAVKATVTGGSTTSLSVTVPIGATFDPISVYNSTTSLTGFSAKPFLLTYSGGNLSGYTYDSAITLHPNNIPLFVSLKDLDADGKMDLLVSAITLAGDDGELLLYRNKSTIGNSIFESPVNIAHVGFRMAIASDLDGDGKPDLAILSSDPIATYLNTSTPGNISFAAGPVVGINSQFNQNSMAVADADGDGKPDIVTSNGLMYRNISTPGNISFEKATTVFGVSRNVLLTDLDGDNKPELVFSDNDNSFSVLKNTSIKGVLSFEAPVAFSGFYHTYMVSGDVDGDGKTDLISADYANSKLGIIRNTSAAGNFSFDNTIELPAKNAPFGIAVSDVDGDGKVDIAVTLSNFDLAVLKNTGTTGTISFEDQVNFIAGTYNGNHIPALGDIDGDGKNDAVTTVSYPVAMVSVHLNTFSNTPSIESFSPLSGKLGDTITIRGTNFSGSSAVSFGGIAAASFIVESPSIIKAVLSTGETGNVSVTTPNGTVSVTGFTYLSSITSFTPATGAAGTTVTITGHGFTGTTNVSFGDAAAVSFTIVSNTTITAVVGNGATGKVSVTDTASVAISTGEFTFVPSLPPAITSVTPIAADEGAAVTISGNNFSSSITGNDVYFGTIKAQVVTASANTLTVLVPHGAVYEHVMVTTNYLTAISPKPFVTTFAANRTFAAGSFAERTLVSGGNTADFYANIQFQDLNGDNKLDIILPTIAGFNVLQNNTSQRGLISFEPLQKFANDTDFQDAFNNNFGIADFDGDSKPDIVQMNTFSQLGTRRNTSTISKINFDTAVTIASRHYPLGSVFHCFAVGDINRDGKPDIATINAFGGAVSIFINTTVGASISFDAPIDIYFAPTPIEVKIEDVDNDQMPDIIATSIDGTGDSVTIFVFRNTTTGNDISFGPAIQPRVPSAAHLMVGDLDGDNKPEIIVSDYQGFSILRNTSSTGLISFAPRIGYKVPFSLYFSFGINDLNGDGKPDIFTTQSDVDSVTVFQNTSVAGNLDFSNKYSYAVGHSSDGMMSGDLDGDGKPDIAIVQHSATGTDQDPLSILRNQIGSAIDSVCAGGNLTLHADASGTIYQWQQNSGTGFSNITDNTAATGTSTPTLQLTNIPASYNGFQYKCIVDGIAGNIITLYVGGAATTTTLTITTANTIVCAGTAVTFTATPSASVTAPSYQWQVNGSNAGSNSATFTSPTLTNNSLVKCVMTVNSASVCNTVPVAVTSNTITMTVNTVIPAVVISGTTTVTKDSATVISTTVTNGGANPVYQWQDSTNIHSWQNIGSATNSNINYKPVLSGDKLRCVMISSAACANPDTVKSNVLAFTVNTVTAIDPVPGRGYSIRYYPNPVNDWLIIDSIKLADQWQTLDIISTNGNNGVSRLPISNQTQVRVNVQQLAPGYYVAVLRRKQGAPVYLKFIKL